METSEQQQLDYIIVGAGAGGLQLAYFLEKHSNNNSYVVLDKAEVAGSFYVENPRLRNLISINKVHTGCDDPEVNLRHDWNSLLSSEHSPLFRDFSEDYFPKADVLVEYLGKFASQHELKIKYSVNVERIDKREGVFVVSGDERGRKTEWRSRCVVVATGFSKVYLPPSIKGIDLVPHYQNVSLDKDMYKGKRVLIVGKGNSGYGLAEFLTPLASLIHIASPHQQRMAWHTHYVGDLRAVNNNFLDTYQLKSGNAAIDADIVKIEPKGDGFNVTLHYSHASDEVETIFYDFVVACTGFQFDSKIFADSCKPRCVLNGKFPELATDWQAKNVDGLYFAGTMMHMRDYKQSQSGFIHGFRYNVRTLFHLLRYRFQQVDYPREQFEGSPKAITDNMIQRINQTSALWQQFGFLCDVYVVNDDSVTHFEELPVDFVAKQTESFFGGNQYFMVTLEFGKKVENQFAIDRKPFVADAEDSHFLHPVIRYHKEGKHMGTVHLLENLFGEWKDEDLHVAPLLEFVNNVMDPRFTPR